MSKYNSFLKFNKKLTEKARDNRKEMTNTELSIWYNVLSNRQLLNYKFLKQKPILNYIVDFYCHKLKLAIEIDGEIHDYIKSYDEKREKDINNLGIKIIRYKNSEVINEFDMVVNDLKKQIFIRERELSL